MKPDSRGIVQDHVHVKVSPSGCGLGKGAGSAEKDFQGTILHRDIRLLVVLIPVEDQFEDQQPEKYDLSG